MRKLHATELVYRASGSPANSASFPASEGRCSLCKRPLHRDGALLVEDVIRETFTNRDLLDAQGKYVCVACAYCLGESKFRRRDFLATLNGVHWLTRADLLQGMLFPPEPPFVFCVGLSHKKHLVIRTRVNLSRLLFYVQFEEQGVWVQPDKHRQLGFSVQALLKDFGKGQISRGDYFAGAKVNPDELFRLEGIVKPYRGSSLFNLFLHAAQSQIQSKDGKVDGEN